MKKRVFGAVIMLIVASPALAGRDNDIDMDSCKICRSWRPPASSDAPPVRPTPFPVCHLVKERVGTRRNGHAVYQTHQICG